MALLFGTLLPSGPPCLSAANFGVCEAGVVWVVGVCGGVVVGGSGSPAGEMRQTGQLRLALRSSARSRSLGSEKPSPSTPADKKKEDKN